MGQRHCRTFHLRFLVSLLLTACSFVFAAATDSPSHFEQANRLYEQGKFKEAASLYESMVKSGRRSPALYFNLGNSYFKDGQFGRALFNYRMAERMAPRDPDIQANLRFTRDRVPDSVSATPSLWKRFVQYFTLSEVTLFTALCFWLWAALFCLVRFQPALKPKLRTALFALGAVLALASAFLALSFVSAQDEAAIIVREQVTVHLGPLAESQPSFTAPDGSELPVLAHREGWLQVRDRSNRSGWIPATNVLIFPPAAPQNGKVVTNNLP